MNECFIYLAFGFLISIISILWGWQGIKNKNKYKNSDLNSADYWFSVGQVGCGIVGVIGSTLFIIIHGCPR
jgi:hypothetical protein